MLHKPCTANPLSLAYLLNPVSIQVALQSSPWTLNCNASQCSLQPPIQDPQHMFLAAAVYTLSLGFQFPYIGGLWQRSLRRCGLRVPSARSFASLGKHERVTRNEGLFGGSPWD